MQQTERNSQTGMDVASSETNDWGGKKCLVSIVLENTKRENESEPDNLDKIKKMTLHKMTVELIASS